ncbi:MAG TPA: asparaginase [Burkholderiaceae bacterium]|nr:asparaginase [Burkholderiaceae bacterium]
MNPILVEATRGGIVESAHRGALAVVDASGAAVCTIGDTARPVFARSAVKVLQALPLVTSGAADAFALTDEELALACASHNGQARHVATAAGVLAKAGLDDSALECGVQWPSHEVAQREWAASGGALGALHNNCSGKHAGFLCVGCLMARAQGRDAREFVRGYVRPDHPVMREVSAALQAATGCDLARAPMGTDGCSIPTYGIALNALALAFARVATGVGLSPERARAAARLRAAVAKAPFFVAGSGRFDTQVMQRLGERVFCKVGAEGVFCAALPEHGLGVAIKIDDGNTARAAEVVMAAAIEALVRLSDDERTFMRGLSDVTLKNWNGIEVGALRATAALRSALPAHS